MIRAFLIICLLPLAALGAQRDAMIFSGWEWGQPSSLAAGGAEVLRNSTITSGTISVVTSPVNTGTYALRCNPLGTAVGHVGFAGISGADGSAIDFPDANDPVSNNEIWGQFRFRYALKAVAGAEPIFMITNKEKDSRLSDAVLALLLRSDGKLEARNSAGTQLGSTGTAVLAADTWYRIDFRCRANATTAIEIKVNGTTDISATSVTLADPLVAVVFGKCYNNSSQTVDYFYDDFAVSNDGYFDAGVVVSLLAPNANGTNTAWTGDFTDVDDVPPDQSTTVITSSTANASESVNVTDCPANSDIHAVKGMWYGDQAASNDDRNIDAYLRSGTTESNVDTSRFASNGVWTSGWIYDGTTGNMMQRVWNVDPNTSSAWTTAGVNAVQVGIKKANDTKNARATAMAVCVLYTPAPASTVVQGSQLQPVF